VLVWLAKEQREQAGESRVKRELTDDDPMPWGKYRGERMEDVPAAYLLWLWNNGKKHDKQCPVADYIRRNRGALELEHPDGIWD